MLSRVRYTTTGQDMDKEQQIRLIENELRSEGRDLDEEYVRVIARDLYKAGVRYAPDED